MRDLNLLPLDELFAELTRDPAALACLDAAAREDLGVPPHDVTSEALIPAGATGEATFVCRAPGVIAGLAALPMLASGPAPNSAIDARIRDGAAVEVGAAIARIRGPLREILAFERTALNLLCRLSGIATHTARFVRAATNAVPAKPPKVCDTRKTTPGLRALEKYAVRCGGGWLHRMGLYDAMLIKDNHLRALGGASVFEQIIEPVRAARRRLALRFVELEVDTLEQLDSALTIAPGLIDIILLDNMPPDALREAVSRRDARAPGVLLEASGGVTLDTIGAIAVTGVDRISVGALTHSAPALDLALDLD